jgi:hypothetical protein
MTLIYRGQPHTPSNTVANVNSQANFTYRGQTYQRSAQIQSSPKANLVYRGVAYGSTDAPVFSNLSPSFS